MAGGFKRLRKEYGMRPRLVDWSLLVLVLFEAGSGLYSFLQGRPENSWLFVLHGVTGLALVLLLVWKLRRVWKRVADRRRWDWATSAAVAALGFVLLAIGTGVIWTTVQWPLGYPNGMNWHVIFGLSLAVFVVLHMVMRYKPLRRADIVGRRAALSGLAVVATGAALWAVQNGAARAAGLPGAQRRFTGSKSAGEAPGLTFPVTMWMFDNPAPYAADAWRLAVTGNVAHTLTFSAAELAQLPTQEVSATLDCTGGWYTEQVWRGIPVSLLLDQAGMSAAAHAISFVSATGYRWSVPPAEVQNLLLATHVGGVPLDHGHGAPLRLVAPGRRGFQWVKWVNEIRVLNAPDVAQWGIIFSSGL
jgi:DMSO/TMAO reductase YedYZ molybdopterin-dependent catalytic subunit